MSRAFVKEDIDPPERRTRARAASGLPPGATNYITARGARELRGQVECLRTNAEANATRIAELEEILASATIVDPSQDKQTIVFGAKVTVRDSQGDLHSYHVVGVDELQLHADAISWLSPLGKALLATDLGERLTLPSGERVEVVAVEHPD